MFYLTMLDLSSVFDTVDHHIFIDRLEFSVEVNGKALEWLTSYLSGRSVFLASSIYKSKPATIVYGVPQGSVLGPLLC